MTFEKFITDHGDADTARLILSVREWPVHSDTLLSSIPPRTLAVNTIEARRKLRRKLPDWYARTDLVYPTSLCAEQCSSRDTADYKAGIVRKIIDEYARTGGSAVADLTGGLGVDAAAFAKVADKVLYNETDPYLAAAARHNFAALGADNITVSNRETSPETLPEILGTFKPDVIFLDPARRDGSGNKVFLLEDCSPDVLKLLPGLFAASRFILLKLSPMADITMVAERLDRTCEKYLEETTGKGWNVRRVREVHVVASGGECKELLVLLDREWNGGYSLTCRENGSTLTFSPEDISSAKAVLPDSTFARIIFEPGKSLTKAGVFNALCGRFGLVKLARFTHLYTISEPLSEKELEQRCEAFRNFGRIFTVKEILPLNKASLKDVGKRWPRSEVCAKNIPMSSDELRTRLKVSSGDDAHIFGARIETTCSEDNYLIVTSRQF